MKQDRLLLESQVVAAVDKHTNNYDRLDNDITCILEEVPEVVIVGGKEAMNKLYEGEENVPTKERFKRVRAVLDKYDVDDYSMRGLIEELVAALYWDKDFDLRLLYKWLYAICSKDVPADASAMIVAGLSKRYKHGVDKNEN